ncbi:MAG: hypothetical protein H6745_01125 [Deltaproteobacteria bacterium]|nr:hypothetical protein [Deltaproteobacteria bacterium]
MLLRTLAAGAAALALAGTAVAGTPSPTTLATREAAIHARLGADVAIRWDAMKTSPRSLRNLAVPTAGATPADRAARFVRGERDLLRLDGDVVAVETRAFRGHVVRLQQTFAGVPVEGRSVVVKLDEGARVTSVTSDLGPLSVPTPATEITPAEAQAAVSARYAVAATGTPTRVVVANASAGRFAWKVPAMVMPVTGLFWVWVDTETGRVLRTAPAGSDQRLTSLPLRDAEVAR